MTGLRVLYFQKRSNRSGRESLSSRRLLGRFRELADECVLGHVVVESELAHRYRNDPAAADFVSRDLVAQLAPNVIFLEGGLFGLGDDSWRIPRALAESLVPGGAALIVSDADWNEVNQNREHYVQAGSYFGVKPRLDSHGLPLIGMDTASNAGGWKEIVCRPDKMIISEWARPAFDGVEQIAAGIPVPLYFEPSAEIIASGNDGTTHLLDKSNDHDEGLDICPFGSARKVGGGYVVLISAAVSGDVWSTRFPGNTTWLTQLTQFLVREIEADKQVTAPRLRSHNPKISEARASAKPQVFISYAREDFETAKRLYHDLRTEGFNPWLDKENLIAGSDWKASIHEALKASQFVLLLLSSRSVDKRGFVQREVRLALDMLEEFPPSKIFLIPVRLDECEPSHRRLEDLHRVDLFPYESGFRSILRSLRSQAVVGSDEPAPPAAVSGSESEFMSRISRLNEDLQGLESNALRVINGPGMIPGGMISSWLNSLKQSEATLAVLQKELIFLSASSEVKQLLLERLSEASDLLQRVKSEIDRPL